MQNTNQNVIDVPVTEVPETLNHAQPQVEFENVEVFKDVVEKFQARMQELIQSRHVTVAVAERLTEDFMHQNFQSIVKIKYS